MIVPFLLFAGLLFFGLKNGDLDLPEAGIYGAIWLVLLVCFLLLHISPYWFVVPTVILDIVLVLKVFGGDISIR